MMGGCPVRNVWSIVARDVRRLLRVPAFGLAVLPAFYAWVNIIGFWNPYGNTANVRVSVVNRDRGTESAPIAGVDLGDRIVDSLGDNHDIGWAFVDEDTAMRDVKSGRSYAAFLRGDRHPRGFQRPAGGADRRRGRAAAGLGVFRQREGQSDRAEGHGHRREHGRPSGQRHVRLHRQRGGGTGRRRRPRQGRPGAGGRAGCRRLDPLRHRRRHRCRRPDGSDGCARHARRCPPARRRRRQRAGRPLRPA